MGDVEDIMKMMETLGIRATEHRKPESNKQDFSNVEPEFDLDSIQELVTDQYVDNFDEIHGYMKHCTFHVSKRRIKVKDPYSNFVIRMKGDFYFRTMKPYAFKSVGSFYVWDRLTDQPVEIGENEFSFERMTSNGSDDRKTYICKVDKKFEHMLFFDEKGEVAEYKIYFCYLYYDSNDIPIHPSEYQKGFGRVVVLTLTEQPFGQGIFWNKDGYINDGKFIYRNPETYLPSMTIIHNGESEKYEFVDKFIPAVDEEAHFKTVKVDDRYLPSELVIKDGFLTVKLNEKSDLSVLSKTIVSLYKEKEIKYPFRYLLYDIKSAKSLLDYESKFLWGDKKINDTGQLKYDEIIDEYSEEYRADLSAMMNPSIIRRILMSNQKTISPEDFREDLAYFTNEPKYFGVTLVRAILDAYGNENSIVMDLDIGLGDRMLGSITSRIRTFVGYQPNKDYLPICQRLVKLNSNLRTGINVIYKMKKFEYEDDKKPDLILSSGEFLPEEQVLEAWKMLRIKGSMILVFDTIDQANTVSNYLFDQKHFSIEVEEKKRIRYIRVWNKK